MARPANGEGKADPAFDEFTALMLAALGVAGEDITAGDVWVATGADGQIARGSLRSRPAMSGVRRT